MLEGEMYVKKKGREEKGEQGGGMGNIQGNLILLKDRKASG